MPPEQNHSLAGETSLTRGIIIGLLIIVIVILFCALYLWGSILTPEEEFVPPVNSEPETPRADADVQILKTWSSSDEIQDIEADLSSTNLLEVDKELPLIEQDLQ